MATIHRILGHILRCQWIQESALEVVKLRRKVPDQRLASPCAGLGRRPDGFPLPHFAQDICNSPSPPLFGKLPYNAHSADVDGQTLRKSCCGRSAADNSRRLHTRDNMTEAVPSRVSRKSSGRFELVRLSLVRSHVAAASVLIIGTRLAALVGLQQMALTIRAAARVACINRRASRKQSHRLCRSAVVLQRSELGVGVVPIAAVREVAGTVAAHVVALRSHTAAAVSTRNCSRQCCSGALIVFTQQR